MEISEKIKRARRALLLTQQEVADKAGIDVANVCRLENGKSHSETAIIKVCKVLGIDYE